MHTRALLQSEDLWCISRLDAVSFALSGVTCDDSKICACNGEDSSAIFRVGVELSLLWLGEGTVGHDERRRVIRDDYKCM